jgi:NADP-dependent 3-hydroxy acid dehydrogenase YdfG
MKANSVFVITGGASGIGLCTGRKVVAEGHRVAICDYNMDAARAACEELGENAKAFELDVRDLAAWERVLDQLWAEYGAIDVFMNGAGVIYTKFVNDMTDEEIRHIVDVNFLGLVNGCRAVAPRLVEQGHGHIINMGSFAAYTTLTGQAVYCATKHAVRAFTFGYALELQDTPVAFTLICPAAVNSPMWHQQIHHDAAALSFADTIIEPEVVADEIYKAAEDRPREVLVPKFKGVAAKMVGSFPNFQARVLTKQFQIGKQKQEAMRRQQAEA